MPIVIGAASVDEDIALFDEGFTLLTVFCLSVRDDELSAIRLNNLDLPFLPLLDPLCTDNLVAQPDIPFKIVLLGNLL